MIPRTFDERIRTLVEDAAGGFVLVCLALTLFLRTQVAFWASVGILISLLGALWWMALLDIPLNMLSLWVSVGHGHFGG